MNMDTVNIEVRRQIDDVIETHMIEEDRRFNDLQQEIKELRRDIKDLMIAWQQAKGVLSFIKWTVGISGSVAAFIAFLKDHFR